MKLNKRSNMYTASNVVFNANTNEATSYVHWKFLKPIRGKLVFNTFAYSPTTQRHYSKVGELLNSLGVKVDFFINSKTDLESATWGGDALQSLNDQINDILEKLSSPRRKKSLDQERLLEIKNLRLEVLKLTEFLDTLN